MSEESRLGPEHRRASLARMRAESFDIVVVGGGVTGCGVALDAATRGLSVALIEKRDFAAGTSSRSSKLIHGGLRYLEQLHFGLVHEALTEQSLLLDRLCPHLVRPVPFLFPLTRRVWERIYVGAGVLLYDMIAQPRSLPWHRHLSRAGALLEFPSLRDDAVVGAIQYWDAQVDDARHTLTLARTAAARGAAMATSLRAVAFPTEMNRVCGVEARCLETGETLVVKGRQVINASGVWTEEVRDLSSDGRLRVRASKGIHLLVPRDRITSRSGLITRTESSVLFVIPWKQHWIIGTTDTSWQLDKDHPAASRVDIDYLLATVNDWLRSPLGHDDVVGVYAGLRPLLYGEDDATSKLSREHAVATSKSGLVSIAGGKYTTYRVMAKDAVDVAAGRLGRDVPASQTETTPLLGAKDLEGCRARRSELAGELGVAAEEVDRLLGRYGDAIDDLVSLVHSRRDLAQPIEGAEAYLRVEAAYAVSHEAALHVDDVLTRRTRISIETPDRGVRAARCVADLMAETLGWDDATRARELAHYDARVAAERESQTQPDDRTADAARLGAPDVRTSGSA